MTSWANRIKSRMKELEMTQEVLAKKMGITRGAVTHYLSGRRVPPLRQFQKLAAILQVDPAWLQFGSSSDSKENNVKSSTKTEKSQHTKSPIPVLSWEQISECIGATKIVHHDKHHYLQHIYTDQAHWYALHIKGDSMTAPLGTIKSFYEGDIIIVDPKKEAKHGNYVIALLPRSKEAIFKQYVIDGGIRYLKPLNPQYPIIEIDDSTHICGVVIGCLSHYSFASNLP